MFILCSVVLPAAAWGQVIPLEGHWEGALEFRGDAMPVRIHIDQTGGAVNAALDLPGLLMSWEPIPVELTNMGAEVEFPFGIGVLAIQVDGEGARAEKALGEDALVLRLERS